MGVLCYAFGRMWGGRDNVLYYSEPNELSLFGLNDNRFEFESDVVVIARVPTGLFVGLESRTVFFGGTEPEKMSEVFAGPGSIRGTLAYCNNLPELGDVLGTPEKTFVDVPVWRTTEGIVAGNASGRLYNLTKPKLRMGVPGFGASLYRTKNGVFQYLTSSRLGNSGSGRGATDSEALAAFKAGKIPTDEYANRRPDSGFGLGETVEATVTRNGETI
jgi:hypothetical protein